MQILICLRNRKATKILRPIFVRWTVCLISQRNSIHKLPNCNAIRWAILAYLRRLPNVDFDLTDKTLKFPNFKPFIFRFASTNITMSGVYLQKALVSTLDDNFSSSSLMRVVTLDNKCITIIADTHMFSRLIIEMISTHLLFCVYCIRICDIGRKKEMITLNVLQYFFFLVWLSVCVYIETVKCCLSQF